MSLSDASAAGDVSPKKSHVILFILGLIAVIAVTALIAQLYFSNPDISNNPIFPVHPAPPSPPPADSFSPVSSGNFSIGDAVNHLDFTYTPFPTLILSSLSSSAGELPVSSPVLWEVDMKSASSEDVNISSDQVHGGLFLQQGNPSILEWRNIPIPNSNESMRVQLSIFLNSDYEFEFTTHVFAPSDFQLRQVHFPSLQLRPIGITGADDLLITPWEGGQSILDPIKNISVATTTASPGGGNYVQLFAYYDKNAQEGIYLSTHDSKGYRKDFHVGSANGAIEWSVADYVPIPSSSTYSSPYSLILAPMHGDWFTAAQAYRSWMLSTPLAARGKWLASSAVSTRMKDARAIILLAPSHNLPGEYTLMENEIRSAVQRLGTDQLIVYLYDWHSHAFDDDWPDTQFKSAFVGLVDRLRADFTHMSILPYFLPGHWGVDLGTAQKIPDTRFPFSSEVLQNSCLAENGAPITYYDAATDWNAVRLDPSQSFSRAHEKQVINAFISDMHVNGVYYDYYSGLAADVCFNDPSSTNHSRYGGDYWTQGKLGLLKEVSAYGKSLSPGFVLTSENMDEFLIPGLDLQSHYPFMFYSAGLPGFIPVPLYSAIYHDYIPLTTINGLDPTQGTTDVLGQAYANMFMAVRFHMGLLPAYSNWQMGRLTLFSNSAPGLEPMHRFGEALVDSYAFTSPYVWEGQMLHPLPGSILDTLTVTPEILATPFSSVWKSASSDRVGIILTNPTSNLETFSSTIDLSTYGFASGTQVRVTQTSTQAHGSQLAGQSYPLTLTSNAQLPLSLTLNPNEVLLIELSKA